MNIDTVFCGALLATVIAIGVATFVSDDPWGRRETASEVHCGKTN